MRRADERAPHKPLHFLYALGRYVRGGDRLIPYAELEDDVERLLFDRRAFSLSEERLVTVSE